MDGFSEDQTTELKFSLEELITECGDDKKSKWTVEYGIKLLKNVKNSDGNIKCVNLNDEYGYRNLDEAITSTLVHNAN